MVKGLHILGPITAFFIAIYILRLFLSKKEGFFNAKTELDIWIIKTVLPLMYVRELTDDNVPEFKLLREALAIMNTVNPKMSKSDLTNIEREALTKINGMPSSSTAYKVALSMKFPTMSESQAARDSAIITFIKKLHKALPSYPFNKFAMDKLNAAKNENMPTMQQCKKFFKCTSVESIPANI